MKTIVWMMVIYGSPEFWMRLVDEAIDEGALAVVEVPDEGNVPYETRIVHQVGEELQVVARDR